MAQNDSVGLDTASVTDAERLDVYRVALEAHGAVVSLTIGEHRSMSVALNVAEGAGLRGRREKRRHYSIARGSAMECVAALDVVRVRGLAVVGDIETARRLNVRVIQMLTRLDRALA